MRALAVLLIGLSLSSASAASQAPAPAKAGPPAAVPPTPALTAPPVPAARGATPPSSPPAVPPPPVENYTYRPEGRRDPFLSLLGAGNEPRSTARRGDGPGGMSVSDISIRGVMRSQGATVAMIEGPDKRTYIVHVGDKLADGVIKTITNQGLVVDQEVKDPLSLIKHRDVTKQLRSSESGKE
jgi:Tfp pilus assembly protein PilP